MPVRAFGPDGLTQVGGEGGRLVVDALVGTEGLDEGGLGAAGDADDAARAGDVFRELDGGGADGAGVRAQYCNGALQDRE